MIGIEYRQEKYRLKLLKENDKPTRIMLFDETEQPLCRLNIETENRLLDRDELVIKNYSENEEITETLFKNEILINTGKYMYLNGLLCPICVVSEEYLRSF